MLPKDTLERVINQALKSQADFAEVFVERTRKTTITLQSNAVEDAVEAAIKGVGIRVASGHNSVYGYTNDWDEQSLLDLATRLGQSFPGEPIREPVALPEQETGEKHQVSIPFDEVPTEKKVELAKRANQAARDYSEEISQVTIKYLDSLQEVQIASSEDIHVGEVRGRTRLAVHSVARNEQDMQSGFNGPGSGEGFEFYDRLDVEAEAKEASRIAHTMLYADEAPSASIPVVVDNGFGGVIFHEACGHSLEATTVAKGASVFSGRKGEQIGSELVTAIDDGTIDNAWGSANYDDEGRPQQRRVLIENGVLKTYMVDHLNGRRMDEPSTGSARRESYRYAPTSRMSNTFIANGDSTFEEIIRDTDYGLYAKKMGGGSVNPSTGDFNFAVMEGYMIRDGKIGEPVKGATLVGTGKDALMRIDRVGNNLERAQGMCGSMSGSVPADVGQPTVRISEITVGGRKGND